MNQFLICVIGFFVLLVAIQASSVDVSSNVKYASPGESATLTCVYNGYNVSTTTIVWSSAKYNPCMNCHGVGAANTQGKCVTSPPNITSSGCSPGSNKLTSMLHIKSLSAEGIATWKCAAGYSSNTVTLVRIAPPNPPGIGNYPQNGVASVTAGVPVTFTCTANGGAPAPRLTWYLQTPGGVSTQQAQSNSGDSSLRWTYTPLKEDNGYQAYCKADQPQISNGYESVSKMLTFNVQYTTVAANVTYVSPGDSVALTCVYHGSTPGSAQLVWSSPAYNPCMYCQGGANSFPWGDCITTPANVTTAQCSAATSTLTSVILINSLSASAITTWTCAVNTYATVALISLGAPGRPSISNYPSGGTATVTTGVPVTFTCTANGGTPAPRLTWYLQTPGGVSTQQAQSNPGDSSLAWSYNPVKENNGYQVYCQADQPDTSNRYIIASHQVALNIQYAPGEATAVRALVPCLLYQTATLACAPDPTYPGNPTPTFTWTRNGGGSWTVTENNGTLNVSINDMCIDQYTCMPLNVIGSALGTTIQLNISARANISNGPAGVITVMNTASSLPYSCSATGRPAPTVTVYGNPVPSIITYSTVKSASGNCGLMETTVSLQWADSDVDKRRMANGKILVCAPSDGFGTNINPAPSTLNVQYAAGAPSSVILTPPDYTYVGSAVNMTCVMTTESNPPYSFLNWYFNSTISGATNGVNNVLHVEEIGQQGYYSCAVVNYPQAGSQVSTLAPDSLMAVRAAPYFTSPQKSDAVSFMYNATNVHASCTVTAKPNLQSSQLVWRKDGQNILRVSGYSVSWQATTDGDFPYGLTHGWTSTLRLEKTGREVTCDNVADYDGEYTCYVTDGTRANTSLSTSLQALYPSIWNRKANMTHKAEMGGNTTLICSVCQNPPGMFLWKFNGQSLPKNVRQSGNALTLTGVDSYNYGNYTCISTNVIEDTSYSSSYELVLIPAGADGTGWKEVSPNHPSRGTLIGLVVGGVVVGIIIAVAGVILVVRMRASHRHTAESGGVDAGDQYDTIATVSNEDKNHHKKGTKEYETLAVPNAMQTPLYESLDNATDMTDKNRHEKETKEYEILDVPNVMQPSLYDSLDNATDMTTESLSA